MKNAYVTALTTSILSGMNPEKALKGIYEVLVKKGHVRLWPQILKASSRVLETKLKRNVPKLTVAKEGGVSSLVIEKALAALGAAGVSTGTVVDETIIGGFSLQFKDKLIDASYKQALLDLYHKVITK